MTGNPSACDPQVSPSQSVNYPRKMVRLIRDEITGDVELLWISSTKKA